MSTRIKEYVLDAKMTSTEGIHDFIEMLEKIIEDIKGGSEEGKDTWTRLGVVASTQWKINVTTESHD
jgi:hypothetical protein